MFGQKFIYSAGWLVRKERSNRSQPIYNLNILAQNGIFVFNPSEDKPLEEFNALHPPVSGDNRIFCFNICKDLSELVKYKIGNAGVSFEYLFPNLEQYSQRILDDYLRFVVG